MNITNAVNGEIKRGDWVISTPDNGYGCLVGQIIDITKLGTPEHDAESSNITDNVHVDFSSFDYPPERIAEIEHGFSRLYGEAKAFSELALDDVIMSPDMLIRVTELGHDEITRIGSRRAECEALGERFQQHIAKNEVRYLGHTLIPYGFIIGKDEKTRYQRLTWTLNTAKPLFSKDDGYDYAAFNKAAAGAADIYYHPATKLYCVPTDCGFCSIDIAEILKYIKLVDVECNDNLISTKLVKRFGEDDFTLRTLDIHEADIKAAMEDFVRISGRTESVLKQLPDATAEPENILHFLYVSSTRSEIISTKVSDEFMQRYRNLGSTANGPLRYILHVLNKETPLVPNATEDYNYGPDEDQEDEMEI